MNLLVEMKALHCEFACLLHNTFANENQASKETITKIISGAVRIEKQFVESALPVSLIGINAKSMVQYVEYVAIFGYKNLGVILSITVKIHSIGWNLYH